MKMKDYTTWISLGGEDIKLSEPILLFQVRFGCLKLNDKTVSTQMEWMNTFINISLLSLKQTWSQNVPVCFPNTCLSLLCKTYWRPLLLIKKKGFLCNLPSKCNKLSLPMMIYSDDSLTAPIIWLYSMWHTLSQSGLFLMDQFGSVGSNWSVQPCIISH